MNVNLQVRMHLLVKMDVHLRLIVLLRVNVLDICYNEVL